jgi:hypothetical protein
MPSKMWGIAAYMFTSLLFSTPFPFAFSHSTTPCIHTELLAAAAATTSALLFVSVWLTDWAHGLGPPSMLKACEIVDIILIYVNPKTVTFLS